MLHEFVALNREEIIRRCRAKVAARSIPAPSAAEIGHGVPLFLDQLADALRLRLNSTPEICRSAILHGHDLRIQGLAVSQVVHDYGDVCQSITELAGELAAPISVEDFGLLNACLDDAIAAAVTQYAREGDRSGAQDGSIRANERLGFFAHELRNLIETASVAFEVLKTGSVGASGSTGMVLARSLVGARDLISRSLAEVRLPQGLQNPERFFMVPFIEELEPSVALAAAARGVTLTVLPVDGRLAVEADRKVLGSVVTNLLQNAFKFTRPRSTVTMRVSGSTERVFIEVQDECGGLPAGNTEELFRPFEQRGANRTGMGLGLAFSRWGVEANHGHIHVRDLPGAGCVFTVDLPRIEIPQSVASAS
jgi:signal transduction histidine kinase